MPRASHRGRRGEHGRELLASAPPLIRCEYGCQPRPYPLPHYVHLSNLRSAAAGPTCIDRAAPLSLVLAGVASGGHIDPTSASSGVGSFPLLHRFALAAEETQLVRPRLGCCCRASRNMPASSVSGYDYVVGNVRKDGQQGEECMKNSCYQLGWMPPGRIPKEEQSSGHVQLHPCIKGNIYEAKNYVFC